MVLLVAVVIAHSCSPIMGASQGLWVVNLWCPHPFVVVVVESLSHVHLFVSPWAVDLQAPLSMGFSRQKYWGGLPFPSSWDLPNPGIETVSPALKADSSPMSHLRSPHLFPLLRLLGYSQSRSLGFLTIPLQVS